MTLNQIRKRTKELDAEIAEFVTPRQEELKELKANQKAAVLKSSFKWTNGKTYKVKDILYYDDHHYDDCPYTPGFKGSTPNIEFKLPGEHCTQRVYFTLPENKSGWYNSQVKAWNDFMTFFEMKFGMRLAEVIEKTHRYEK